VIQKFAGGAGYAMAEKSKSHKILDAVHQQKLEAGLQPFKIVKYFAFSSMGVILVFTLILSWIISNHARDVMLKQSEEYSMLLAENLNQQVFRRFVLEAVVRYGGIALSNPEQFASLDRIIRGIIQGLKIDSVTIYDSRRNIISYSTVNELVGKEDLGKENYYKALEGISNSKFLYSNRFFSLFPGRPQAQFQLKTYIPFRQVKADGLSGENIMGVIEITQDLSKEYGAIIQLQGRIIMVSSVVMSVMFIILSIIVSRAGKKMEHRALERLKLEEKLNQSERLAHLGSMVATVSHEIKSPLGIVRSTAEILNKRLHKIAPENTHLTEIIINETKRLNNIVVEFLDFAKPAEATLKPEDINVIVKNALRFISPQIKEQEVELITDLCPDPKKVNLDSEKFYRAFLNILLNGLQALGENGILQVGTRRGPGGKGMEVYVRDNGVGMTEDTIVQIFNPFYTDKHKGTGLGLAITKNIIDLHDGEISVKSKVDEGTTFTIYIP